MPKQQVTLKVQGMTCDDCVLHVTKALKKVPGVEEAKVNLEEGKAEVTYHPETTSTDEMVKSVQEQKVGPLPRYTARIMPSNP